jgi:hypothetical protein
MPANKTSFRPGNKAALKHGLKSGSITASARARVRAEVRDVLVAGLPHLDAADMPLIDVATDVISDLRQLRTYIDNRGGLVDRKGQPLGCAALYGTLLRQAVAIFDRLGIGPVARASIMGSLGTASLVRKQAQQQLAAEAQKRLRASVLEAAQEEQQ